MRIVLRNLEEIICIAFLAGIVILTSLQVFSRYALANPIIWTEELARFFMIWLIFFGASAGIKRKAHIKIEVVTDKLNKKWKRVFQLCVSLIVAFLLIMIGYQGILLTINMGNIPAVTVPITFSYVYSAVPVGCAFMLFRVIQYRTL